METPGLDHVILTVSDYERARAFYGDLLGFAIQQLPPEHGGQLYFRAGNVMIFLVRHDATPPGDRFSEFRIGLDHLSFAAPSEQTLYDLAQKLIEAGVDTQGVELFAGHYPYVAFRDPDNIQLEYWYTPPRE